MERRSFIKGGAIAALSVTALPVAASNAVERAEWERAVQRYIDAEAAADRQFRMVFLPLSEKAEQAEDAAGLDRKRFGFLDRRKAYMKANPSLYYDLGQAGTDSDRLGDKCAEAFTGAMATPSPDLSALRWKLERLRDNDGDLDSYSADFIEQTFADIARLLPQGR